MSKIPERNRAPQARATKKAPKSRRNIVAALTEAAEKIEALNVQLEALVHRGAR
jgi:hypothetical protein